ncbi:MAG: HTH domain-containing protein [Hydrogenophaga sp.]|uniref:helix-turn-helix transcriptional regulator n=1 Tax=Hydrogenophaga sp. TaxID=1904254 RepID=UPI0027332A0E|nr:HTH domain-containing protein [Hydrogenophaga sp.]MDP3345517.1 HTH domain-containing protein [Hydrogenophaga sp.]MDP3925392.1 HTH domain-containing protein [Hydrogenophaga sp.]
METSKRTIYRDIDALIARRVPIRGEAGVGFVLEGGFDLPTLMFTADEIAAVVLGAEWVAQHAAPALARAATAVLAKLSSVVPETVRAGIHDPVVGTLSGLCGGPGCARRRRIGPASQWSLMLVTG